MKFTKRFLATLLTLALVVSLSLPAMAAVNGDEFRIIKQPQDLTIEHGDSFTLSVEVNVPDGVEVEYQWFYYGDIKGPTGALLQLAPGDKPYPESSTPYEPTSMYYLCQITAVEKDANGNVIDTSSLRSNNARVTILAERDPNLWEKIREHPLMEFVRNPFSMTLGWLWLPLLVVIGVPLLVVVMPFSWLYDLITG